ncbi:MAG: hypothetical protein WC209_03270 [Ignavibacteriaceae bacterium]|jgi:hypothetical protein
MIAKILTILFLFALGISVEAQTPKLEIEIIHDELLPISKNDFLTLSQEIFQYECKRMNFTKDINLAVEIKDLAGDVRGYVRHNTISDSMFLSKDSIKAKDHLAGIFAHELGHIIYSKLIDSLFCFGNMYWGEGFASWAAGKYCLQWQGYQNYDSAIKEIVSSNRFYDIKNIYSEANRHAKQRDVIYVEWASFIDFLIEKYGFEKIISIGNSFAQVRNALSLKDSVLMEVTNLNNIDENIKKLGLKYDDIALKVMPNDKTLLVLINRDEKIRRKEPAELLEAAYLKIYNTSFDELKKQWKLKNKIIN